MTNVNRAFASCPDEEICVAGISGFFPNANDVYELKRKLYSKVANGVVVSCMLECKGYNTTSLFYLCSDLMAFFYMLTHK